LRDLLVAVVLTVSPSAIYNNPITLHLKVIVVFIQHISDAAAAPGFNQAIACMTTAVGVGHIVAARSGPAVTPSILAMLATWGTLSIATCVASKELGSATVLWTGMNHLILAGILHWSDPSAVKWMQSPPDNSIRLEWSII
ncbi:hypothetical protein CPB85DRAFT_1227644, partial [Mucidula mucida]